MFHKYTYKHLGAPEDFKTTSFFSCFTKSNDVFGFGRKTQSQFPQNFYLVAESCPTCFECINDSSSGASKYTVC